MQSPIVECFPTDERWNMAGPTLGDRVLDVERGIQSLHGWRTGILAGGALLLAVIGWWVNTELMPAVHGLEGSLSTNNTRLSTLEGEMKQLHIDMLGLRSQQFPEAVVNDLGKLQSQEFFKTIPALQQGNFSPPVLRYVSGRLLTINETTPGYWPTVLRFIQFASASLSPDVPPPGEPNLVIAQNMGNFSLAPISHRRVKLDGGDLVNTRFDHSRIIFTEHPVHMKNVIFADCVFEMPILATPNQYLQNASRVLLASDLKSATISGL